MVYDIIKTEFVCITIYSNEATYVPHPYEIWFYTISEMMRDRGSPILEWSAAQVLAWVL